jgi:hypothetical protein
VIGASRWAQVALVLAFLASATVAHARSHRSYRAKHQFELQTGHPYGWDGHIVDHIIPLACGGQDAPANMQWQTTEDAKEKDRWERKVYCAHQPVDSTMTGRHPLPSTGAE